MKGKTMKTLFLIIATLFVVGCSQEKKEQQHTSQAVVQQAQSVTAASGMQKEEPIKSVKTEKNVTAAVQKVEAKETPKVEEKVAQKPVVSAEPAVEVAPVKTETVPKEVAIIDKTEIDGAKIFVKCSSCHGKSAEKKALGKSQVIKGWAQSKIVDALHGYKAGTYGGAMKAVMKGQASSLSDADINAVAKYISEL